jgi:hypothetical protein
MVVVCRGHDKIGATAYASLDKKGTQQKIHISEGSDRALDMLSNSVVDDCRDTLAKFHAMATIRHSLSS